MPPSRPARQLLLLRHAKSAPAAAGQPDIERSLHAQGVAEASAMGREMVRLDLLPDKILCSPARRAQETLRVVLQQFRRPRPFVTLDGLYDFGDGGKLLGIIRSESSETERLLLVGHNPAIGELAKSLSGYGGGLARQRLSAEFPTGAMAVIATGAGDWTSIDQGQGELVHFIRPADLAP